MRYIHSRQFLNAGEVVDVHCSHRCNVRLMDDENFHKFKIGAPHKYYGGHYRVLPARIVVPRSGHWNVTLDLGGADARIQYDIRVLRLAA